MKATRSFKELGNDDPFGSKACDALKVYEFFALPLSRHGPLPTWLQTGASLDPSVASRSWRVSQASGRSSPWPFGRGLAGCSPTLLRCL